MPSIPLSHAMILWTPRRAPWMEDLNVAPAGSITIAHWPDDRGAYGRFPKFEGAGTIGWADGTDEDRLQQLADIIARIIGEDRVPPAHVGEAMCIIEGIERLRDFEPSSAAAE